MPIGYLETVGPVALITVAVLWPSRRPAALARVVFVLTHLLSEAPAIGWIWLLTSTALAVAGGQLASAGGAAVAALAVFIAAGLVEVTRRGLRTGRAVDHALNHGLGPAALHSFDLLHSPRFVNVIDGIGTFTAAVRAATDGYHPSQMNLTPSETVTGVPSENTFSVYGRMTALPGQRDELIVVLLDGFRASGDGVCYAKTSFITAGLAFHDRYAALRYSLIKLPRTCLRSIRALRSAGRPAGHGGSCRRL